jgi:HTH-type transcriptional regulator/antitoxin HigA
MAELYEQAPVKEMQRRHWIKPARSAEELESELRRFWGEALAFRVAARANAGPGYALTPSQYTWCRQALRLSSGVGVRTYSKEALKTSILALRALASYPEEVRKVPRALADMGIRFLVVEHLPRSLIDGAALWRSDGAPVVALSLRFARIDSFWHTLCHELAHILSEDNQNWLDIDLIGSKAAQKTSQELVEAHANRMAADMLIPQDKLNGFIARKRPYFYKEDIKGFAKIMGVHPGIVVGQLQFLGIIPYSANREMLVDVRNIVIQSALTDGWGHTITDN